MFFVLKACHPRAQPVRASLRVFPRAKLFAEQMIMNPEEGYRRYERPPHDKQKNREERFRSPRALLQKPLLFSLHLLHHIVDILSGGCTIPRQKGLLSVVDMSRPAQL